MDSSLPHLPPHHLTAKMSYLDPISLSQQGSWLAHFAFQVTADFASRVALPKLLDFAN